MPNITHSRLWVLKFFEIFWLNAQFVITKQKPNVKQLHSRPPSYVNNRNYLVSSGYNGLRKNILRVRFYTMWWCNGVSSSSQLNAQTHTSNSCDFLAVFFADYTRRCLAFPSVIYLFNRVSDFPSLVFHPIWTLFYWTVYVWV